MSIFVAIIVSVVHPVRCLWYTLTMLIVTAVFEVMIQMIRATFDNKTFIVTTLSASAFTAIFAVIFVVIMDLGIDGIFYQIYYPKLWVLALAEYRVGLFTKYLDFRQIDKSIGYELLRFTIPMIPSSICWWLISSSNRFFIKKSILVWT